MDYVDMALESLLEENVMMRNITINRMVAESEFILSSMENGIIGEFVQEATIKETAQKVLNALKEFIDKIVVAFRKKIVEKYKKYIDWVKENSDAIVEKAANTSVTMAPYWECDWKKGQAMVESLINDAFKVPYKDDDISFTTNVLQSVKSKDDLNDTGKLSAALKNKFRFNIDEFDNGKITKATVSNSDLVAKAKIMIDYVLNYDSVSKGLSNLTNKWINSSRQFYATQESTDLLSRDTFLLIEGTQLRNSDLSLLSGFENLPVFEAGENDNKDNKNGNDKKQNESLTSVQNNSTDSNQGQNTQSKGGSTSERYKVVDRFVRLAFSAYLTACEERFIVYIKCISQILGESPKEVGK